MTDSGSGCVGWMIDDSVLVLGSRDGTRSLGAKGVESGVKGRQIRRPFHSDCDLLCTFMATSLVIVVIARYFYCCGVGKSLPIV